MTTSVSVCTYHRSIENNGISNNFIKKIIQENIKDFYIHYDKTSCRSDDVDLTKVYGSKIFSYSADDFKLNDFNKPIDRKHRWGNHQNPIYFYAHFRMLLFYMEHPDYSYYWFLDDDIDFDKNFRQLLESYDIIHDDFIAIQAFKKDDYQEFPHISKINSRMSSGGRWLDLCPGPGDNFLTKDKHIGSFFPIVRFSNKAMSFLLKVHKDGYYGYSEGFVPTTLASSGFKVSSMLDENDQFFFQHNTDCNLLHKNIKFTWGWI